MKLTTPPPDVEDADSRQDGVSSRSTIGKKDTGQFHTHFVALNFHLVTKTSDFCQPSVASEMQCFVPGEVSMTNPPEHPKRRSHHSRARGVP